VAALQAGLETAKELSLDKEPRIIQIAESYQKLSKKVLIWEVVGGARDGGVLVREGPSLQSPELKLRLAAGSVVREIAEKGDRLCYQLLQGTGPAAGWISVKVRGKEILASVSKKPELAERAFLLLQRLARLPKPLQQAVSFSVIASQKITDQVYEPRRGCLDTLAKQAGHADWLKHATLKTPVDVAALYPGFLANDEILQSLLADPSLVPVRRVFPKPPKAGETNDAVPSFCPSMDPMNGLMPDTVSSALFVDADERLLKGAVRFGAQATQSMMSRTLPKESGDAGEFAPGVHGGAMSALLSDAAVYLCRLTWAANATLTKISLQFSKPCPCYETLELSANWGAEDFLGHHTEMISVKINLRKGKISIAFAEASLVSFPQRHFKLPANLPARCGLAPPGVAWVPPELAVAHLPPSSDQKPYDEEQYLTASFDKEAAAPFPRSCAAVEEVGAEEQNEARGWRKHWRSNRPCRGQGDIHQDLCFPGGLSPAAISFEKYYVKEVAGIRFVGIVKFGPQASEAIYLSEDGKRLCDGSMSLVAHAGMALAAMDDHLAHLPRCDGREKTTVTWKQEMTAHALIPLGQELDFECFCPIDQQGVIVGTSVIGEIRYENQVLATLSAIITSREGR